MNHTLCDGPWKWMLCVWPVRCHSVLAIQSVMYLQISYVAEVERGLCSLQQRIEFVKAHVVWFHPLWWITVLLLPKKRFFSVKGFHSDLFIDDRSLINLRPHLHIWKQCDVISNVGWNGWANFWWVENQRLGARIRGGVWGSWSCH